MEALTRTGLRDAEAVQVADTEAKALARTPQASPQWAAWTERWLLVVALAALVVACVIALPEFRSASLFVTMLNAQALVLLLALTGTLTLRLGDFDLSVAQTMVASAAVAVVSFRSGLPVALAIAASLAFGLAVGALNALLVVRVGVDSFVATLGTFTLLSGTAYLLTDSRVVAGAPEILTSLARHKLFELPMITWYAWALAAAVGCVYERTPLGRYMLFIGGNRRAAYLSGIAVQRIRGAAYIGSSLLAALAGLLFAGYYGAVDPSVGSQFMLQPFAAAFLGATAVTVGRFNAWGTVAALYLLTVGITALQLLGAQTWVTNVFYGGALIVAVTASKLAGGRRSAGRRAP